MLDKAGIPYELVAYTVDENNLAASHIAEELNEDIRTVFKTLVLSGERVKNLVCVVPGNCEIDLKKAARAAGDKKVEMIPMKELLPLTGYIRGGCSPIGMKKPFPTIIDSSALSYPAIHVSAGQRGLQLKINPQALIDYIGATVADIANCENHG